MRMPYKNLYSYADTQTSVRELTGTIWILEKPNFAANLNKKFKVRSLKNSKNSRSDVISPSKLWVWKRSPRTHANILKSPELSLI